MGFEASLLDRVYAVQTTNSSLRGLELRDAGKEIASLALSAGSALMAVDGTGERLIGSALCAHDEVVCVDSSQRLDGTSVLLVAGYLAGTTGIAVKARFARSLGARSVRAVFLGDENANVDGCERVTNLRMRRHLVAL